ncbi:hypothetical protein [Cereibacter azotoformans]|nr:hypothetical protein [Cereibacter azotoformans]
MVYAVQKTRKAQDIHLDQPTQHYGQKAQLLSISGWARRDVKKILIRFNKFTISCDKLRERPDVSTRFRNAGIQIEDDYHGFSVAAPLASCTVHSVDQSGNEKLQWTIDVVQVPNVSLGGSGWLFLSNSNSLREQADGTADMAPSISAWDRYLDKFSALADEVGAKWCYCIAPSKELIKPDLAPFKVSDQNGLVQFLNGSRHRSKFVCPIDELKLSSSVSYWGGDTHWSSVGAAIASRDVLRYFGVPHELEPYANIEMRMQGGDLGNKLMGAYKALYPHLSYKQPYKVKHTAYRKGGNTGQLSIMQSERPDVDGTLLVSGGSSFVYMERFLAPWFKTTYFLHGTGRMDPALMREIKPTHVMLQNNSRFMIVHPDKGEFCDVAKLIDVKKLVGSEPSGLKAYDRAVDKLRSVQAVG